MTLRRRTALGLAMASVVQAAHTQDTHGMTSLKPIHDAAIAEVQRFYAPFGNRLDASHWRVSIEDFVWQDAVYRIDVAVDEYPTLVPWRSAYVMAHRIWMTANGRAVQTEPIYDRVNLAIDEKSDELPANRRGFYPGNVHFAAELAFLNTALQHATAVMVPLDRLQPGIVLRFQFPQGTQDLASGHAEVIETNGSFKISMTPPTEMGGSRLGNGYQLRFSVEKISGNIVDPQLVLITPPSLM